MFKNIGTIEIAILALIIVVLFGGKKIAEWIRGMGEAIKAYRNSSKSGE